MMAILPLLFPGKGRRRVWDHVGRLEHQLAGAGRYIGQLEEDVTLLSGDLELTRYQLGNAKYALDVAVKRIAQLEETAARAAEANSRSIDVPAPRDVRADDDRPTVPTDVSGLRARFAPPSPVVTLNYRSPQAASPIHIPSWAIRATPLTKETQ